MTDLVKQLRWWGEDGVTGDRAMLVEAADEITRLRAALAARDAEIAASQQTQSHQGSIGRREVTNPHANAIEAACGVLDDTSRRTSPDSVWPLRGADGLTWAERKAKNASRSPT